MKSPSITLDTSQIPELSRWKPGDRIRVVVDVEVTRAGYDDKTEMDCKILAARPQYGGGPVKGAKANFNKSDTMKALQRKAGQ